MRAPLVSRLFVPNTAKLQCNYSPVVALFNSQKTLLSSNSLVDRLKVEDELSQARSDQLRWKVVSHTSQKVLPLSTQRNRLRRKWNTAFEESLRKRGLNVYGKSKNKIQQRLGSAAVATSPTTTAQEQQSQIGGISNPQEIAGTFEMLIFEGLGFNEPTQELVATTDRIVDALLRAGSSGVSRNGGGGGSTRRPNAQKHAGKGPRKGS